MKKPSRTEHEIQSAFISWCNFPKTLECFPELELIYAIPNGANKSIATAMKFKREGLKPGVPDLHLPVPRGEYHSLYLEFKSDKSKKLSGKQIEWFNKLTSHGNMCVCVASEEKAEQVVKRYLSMIKKEMV